jgi:hypothetical protein
MKLDSSAEISASQVPRVLLVVLLLAAAGARAGELAPVVVVCEPTRIVLGTDAEATILVSANAPAKTRLTLTANVGRVSRIEALGPGRWQAHYSPPKKRFPQVAILSAVLDLGDRTLHGWTSLPLTGTGVAQVVSLPRAKVWVKIGKRKFGPVRADRDGRAKIPIQVPPGINHAMSAGQRIDLHLPPFNRLSAQAAATRLPVDSLAPLPIFLITLDALGRPDSSQAPSLRAKMGTLGMPKEQVPGVWRVDYQPSTDSAGSSDSIDAELPGAPGSTARIAIELLPGSPARLTLTVLPETYTAGQIESPTLKVQAFDRSGAPTLAQIDLSTDLGTLSDTHPTSTGGVEARLTLPNRFEGRKRVRLMAKGESGLQAEATLRLAPGKPARIVIAAPIMALKADGRGFHRLDLQALDAHGNPARLPELQVDAERGQASLVSTESDTAAISYRPPKLRKRFVDTLTASAGPDLTGYVHIELEPPPAVLGVAPLLGFRTNFSSLHSPLFALELSTNLPFWGPAWHLALEAAYFYSERSHTDPPADSHLSLVPLLGSLAFRPKLTEDLRLLLNAGAGALFSISRMQIEGQPDQEENDARWALQACLGLAYGLGPGELMLRLRYLYAPDVASQTVRGPLGGFSVQAGYRFAIF